MFPCEFLEKGVSGIRMLIFKFYSLFWIRNANGLREPSSLPPAAGGSRASLSWGLEGPAGHTACQDLVGAAPPAWNLLGSVTAPHAKKQIQMLGPLPSDLKCKLRVTRTQNATEQRGKPRALGVLPTRPSCLEPDSAEENPKVPETTGGAS